MIAITAGCGGGTNHLDRAAEVLADDARFVTSAEAGRALNEAAAEVLADAKDCTADRSARDRKCVARFQLAAFFQAESVEVTPCERDERRTLRATARRALSRMDDEGIPMLIRCAGGAQEASRSH